MKETNKKEKIDSDKKFMKQEIVYNAIVEKELLHNGLVQREMLKTLKDLNETMKDSTIVLKNLEKHQFLQLHRSTFKIIIYNLAQWMLFAIWTVLWLLFLSWLTYNFLKDSGAIQNIVEKQLNIRQFNVTDIKEKIKEELNNNQNPNNNPWKTQK